MNGNEYQKLALRTCPESLEKPERLLNAVLGLSGESGEVADHVKKHLFQGHELDRMAVVNELGDVLWYCALLADAVGVDLETAMELNVAKLQNRYPDGFSKERSINR